jgi:hypothetical protein
MCTHCVCGLIYVAYINNSEASRDAVEDLEFDPWLSSEMLAALLCPLPPVNSHHVALLSEASPRHRVVENTHFVGQCYSRASASCTKVYSFAIV